MGGFNPVNIDALMNAPQQDTVDAQNQNNINSIVQGGANQPRPTLAPQQPQQSGSPLKNVLSRFFYGAGQGMLHEAGLPTDVELQTHQAQMEQMGAATQATRAETQNRVLQNQMMQRRAAAFEDMGAHGFNDPTATLGQLTPDEQAQIQAGKTTAVLTGDLGHYFGGVDKVVQNRAVNSRMGGSNLVIDPATGEPMKQLISKGGQVMGQLATTPQSQFTNNEYNLQLRAQNGDTQAAQALAEVQNRKVQVRTSGYTALAAARAQYTPFETQDGRLINVPQALKEGIAGSHNPLIRMGYQNMLPAYDADQRLKVMLQSNEQAKQAEASGGNAGSYDMVLLFNHMAMTGGNVTGMRMGEQMTAQHAQARGIPESLRVMYNKVASGSQLSQEQRDNFTRLGLEIRNAKWQQGIAKANAMGVNDVNQFASDPDLPPPPQSGILGGGLEGAQNQFGNANKAGGSNIPKFVRDRIPQAGGVQVADPRGVMHTFPNQAAADAFKNAAGIR
jgi:hypothetical protein